MLRSDEHVYQASGSVEMPIEDLSLVVKTLHLYPYIALICGCLAGYRKRGRIRRLLNSCLRLQSIALRSRVHPNARLARVNSASDEIVGNSTAVPNPSTSSASRIFQGYPSSFTLHGDFAHIFSRCHHDVKPSNILVMSKRRGSPYDCEFKIADLGLIHYVKYVPSQGEAIDVDT